MPRLGVVMVATAVAAGGLAAAPVPRPAQELVAKLSDSSAKARDETAVALRGRADAAPWLRRAARSADKDTARRAADLLAEFAKKRQAMAPAAINACIRDGRADLFVEWHHFWQPESKDDLWPVGPKASKLGMDTFAKLSPMGRHNSLADEIDRLYAVPATGVIAHDGPFATREGSGAWRLRTDLIDGNEWIAFASVAGLINTGWLRSGYYFTLGNVRASRVSCSNLVCDGRLDGEYSPVGIPALSVIGSSFVACRGNAVMPKAEVRNLVLLVEGDVDLSNSEVVQDSTIRASGEIVLKKGYKPVNCTIQPRARDATAPYRFFELADVGLGVADDEEGMVVADLRPGTSFGASGLKKGDVVLAIDDAPPGHSSAFSRAVRRALVRQGDCLLTVARGRDTLDVPVYFPTAR